MSKTNMLLVREYVEDVYNAKRFDRVFDYCTRDCVIHIPPYVGLGVTTDETADRKVILLDVDPHGPSRGRLIAGDVLVRVHDEERSWETFEELKAGLWGQGIPGSILTVTVERNGNLLTLSLTRNRVEGWGLRFDGIVNMWRDDIMRNWPDLHISIEMILEFGDHVTCYTVSNGIHHEYQRRAVWSEVAIYRIRNSKIAEVWSVEDSFARMKQLGYLIMEPAREPA